MELAENLRKATRNAQNFDDLPNYLAERIFAITGLLPRVRHNPDEI